ncbi:MAG: S1 RNA-binding domain-containing protein, partial [Nakamurella sp.]
VRVYDGIEGLVHISELAGRHVEIPEQVVTVDEEIFVRVIDIDLERRRISLSLKQANEGITPETEFDEVRAQYGVVDHYDEQGNFVPPEGFDVTTGEWLDGFDSQREAWEKQYSDAQETYAAHLKQVAAAIVADAAAAEPSNYSSSTGDVDVEGETEGATAPSSEPTGSLVNDEQLAALKERLAGN